MSALECFSTSSVSISPDMLLIIDNVLFKSNSNSLSLS
jgi:hypothetical protein